MFPARRAGRFRATGVTSTASHQCNDTLCSLISKLGAHAKWAACPDRTAATAAGRKAALDRFEREVDPDGTLDPAERAQRAEHAKKAFFTRMAIASAQARRARKSGGQPA
jgi:hypothetical protein